MPARSTCRPCAPTSPDRPPALAGAPRGFSSAVQPGLGSASRRLTRVGAPTTRRPDHDRPRRRDRRARPLPRPRRPARPRSRAAARRRRPRRAPQAPGSPRRHHGGRRTRRMRSELQHLERLEPVGERLDLDLRVDRRLGRRGAGRDGRPLPGRRVERPELPRRLGHRAQRHPVELRHLDQRRGGRAADDPAHDARRGDRRRARRRRGLPVALRPRRRVLALHAPGGELPARRAGDRLERHGGVHVGVPRLLRRPLAAHPLRGLLLAGRRHDRPAPS